MSNHISGRGRLTEHPAFWPTVFVVPSLLIIAMVHWSALPLLMLITYFAVVAISEIYWNSP